MKVKRIAMNKIDENSLEKLKKRFTLNNEEALSLCIQTTYNKYMVLNDEHSQEQNDSDIEKEILEYVKLLVKANKELPPKSNPEEMERYVNAPTRFDDLVQIKIKEERNE